MRRRGCRSRSIVRQYVGSKGPAAADTAVMSNTPVVRRAIDSRIQTCEMLVQNLERKDGSDLTESVRGTSMPGMREGPDKFHAGHNCLRPVTRSLSAPTHGVSCSHTHPTRTSRPRHRQSDRRPRFRHDLRLRCPPLPLICYCHQVSDLCRPETSGPSILQKGGDPRS